MPENTPKKSNQIVHHSYLGCGHCGGGGRKQGTGMIYDRNTDKNLLCLVCGGSGWIEIRTGC